MAGYTANYAERKDCAKFICMFMKKAVERDGKKWGKVCKARSDAAKAKYDNDEIYAIAAKAANAANATDKDKEKEKEYDYVCEKEKERSAHPKNGGKSYDLDEFEEFMRSYIPKLSH